MRRGLLSVVLAFAIRARGQEAFDPRHYEQFKEKATCKALNRHGGEGVPDEVHIDISYVNINPSASPTMLLVHGWPATWTTWSRQISYFEQEYHLLVPDQRGFASSAHPGDVEASGTIGDMVGDMVCVLDHAGVQQAICVGHDWGAQVCWMAARMRPDRFEAVVGVTVPYIPSDKSFAPVEELAKAFPKLTYQVFFEKNTQAAIVELNKDIRRSLRAVLRGKTSPPPESFLTSTTSFLDAYSDYEEIPPPTFFSPQEEDYMVEEFSKQGFDYSLQFYTYHNRYESWRGPHEQGNHTIPQPALFVAPLEDPVGDWILAMKFLGSENFIPHLTTKTIGTHHWPHLEAPEEFNKILDEWLKGLGSQKLRLQEAKGKRHGSEGEL